MTELTERISLKEKIGYSVGDTASNFFFQIFVLFLLYYYTDVFGLPAAAVGTMLLVTRIWDAINDPIMGMLADRTNTRWSKFRPYLIFCALPFTIIGVLTFTTPGFDTTGKLIYAYITYTLMMMIYTAINVPYSALMAVITPNSMERTELSTFRFVAAFVGAFIVQSSTMKLVEYFGGGEEVTGWQLTIGLFAGVAFILFFITFFTTKERVHPPRDQKSNFKRDLTDLFTKIPWLLIAGATVFQLTYIVMRGSSIPCYFKYYIKEQSVDFLGGALTLSVPDLISSFFFSGTLATILGAILTKWVTKILDKKNTYSFSLIISSGLCIFYIFLTPHNIGLIYILHILLSFFVGIVSVLQWAIYTDTADYSEWKNGRRATGLVMSASLFALKLGLSLGGAIVGWVLAYYGFIANQDQTTEGLNGIVLLVSLFPAIIGILGGILMLFYPITNELMVEIEEDLRARRVKMVN